MRRGLLAAVCALALVPAAATAAAEPAVYQVGVGVATINPRANELGDPDKVFLGGYGIGCCMPGNPGRWATGIADDATGHFGHGLDVRAIAIGDGQRMVVLADAALQGWFAASRDGAYGIVDVRRDIERLTGGAVKATDIVVQSDHSHSGPDLLGVWGGATTAYRSYVKFQTEQAILEAIHSARPATLWYGTADGSALLGNQFAGDPNNSTVDSDVRVLQARDPDSGDVLHTMLDFSAHATVLGSQPLASGDWPQAANPAMEEAFGGDALTIVGTLGRTQPADGNTCPGNEKTDKATVFCELQTYVDKLMPKVREAVAAAQPVTGTPKVDSAGYMIKDPGTNAFLLGLLYAGSNPVLPGAPVNRSDQAPWLQGNLVGTSTTTMRIGDLLLSAGPGEMYPQIPLTVRASVSGVRGFMTAGLANDQLGYLIAPLEAYPEPVAFTAAALANDNYAFNVSHTLGERVTCSLLRGAGAVFGLGTAPRDSYARCNAFATDLSSGAGSDVPPAG
jgi:hypothetical protein